MPWQNSQLSVSGSIVNNYDKIEYVSGNRMLANLELIIILDGSFDSYTTQQIIAYVFYSLLTLG